MSANPECNVVVSDERTGAEIDRPPVDIERWATLAQRAASARGAVGELTLTFVDLAEITELNDRYMGQSGPTDVLSFPMDDEPMPGIPTLLGDIVISPAVADVQFATHAGSLDDEIALLVVHGVLHILGCDHAEPDEALEMRAQELALLVEFHWGGEAPAGFRQLHDPSDSGRD